MSDKFGDKIRLQHTLDAITQIHGYINNAKLEEFIADQMMQDACLRQLQVIGEAMNRVSSQLQNFHSEIQWAQISGLRNIVVHEYFGIDLEVIWNIIEYDLIVLMQQIAPIIDSIPDSI